MLIIGHRGAKGYEPENTLRAFSKGMELGADMLELDVHLSADGRLMVIHDSAIDRTTNGKGVVVEKTADELRAFDAGEGEKIPFLEEVIDLVDRRAPINIELKVLGTAVVVAGTIERYLDKGWNADRFCVSSFDHNELAEFIRRVPVIEAIAAIVGVPFGFAKYAADFGARSISIPMEMADSRLIADAKDRGMKVYVWSLSEPDDFVFLAKKMGVDGCITNFPDRIKSL